MSAIVEKLHEILNIKNNIKQAIRDKGVDMPDNTRFANYPDMITSIEDKYTEGYDNGYANGYNDGINNGGSGGSEGGDSYYRALFNQRTDNGNNMRSLFYECPAMELDLSNLDTNNVTNINHMFYGCNNLTTLDVSGFNISNINTLSYIFSSCTSLSEIIGLNDWNTTNVNTMDSVFYHSGISSLDLSSWDVSNVSTMTSVFSECRNLSYLNLTGWDTRNVTNMSYMFAYMQSEGLPTLDLSHFYTDNLTNACGMFNWCNYLQKLDIRNFDLTPKDDNEVDISSMFEGCDNLRTLHLNNCNRKTISRIINDSSLPLGQAFVDGEPVARQIICKEINAADLTVPDGWEFVFIN